ncbi:hypothetical protein [Rhodoferax sp. PAMC 29310]
MAKDSGLGCQSLYKALASRCKAPL